MTALSASHGPPGTALFQNPEGDAKIIYYTEPRHQTRANNNEILSCSAGFTAESNAETHV